jgi:two-component system chemotaxis response regulator CheB
LIKVLIADDSALMRKLLTNMLSSEQDIEVVGKASNGKIAIEQIKALSPDVVLMDIEMPEMDGISAIKVIVKECPVPVIVISAHSKEGSERTLEAMNAGAIDFIPKPSGEISLDIDDIKEQLIAKVRASVGVKVKAFVKKEVEKITQSSFSSTRKKIVVIGSSTGGPQTLEALLQEFPKEFPCPILIVQHMPKGFTQSLAKRLNGLSHIEIREAKEGDALENGVALIAPGGKHMELIAPIEGMEGEIRLNELPPELGVRPNANRLFKSVVKIFKENTIGVVLTGMGSDGTEGCREIKNHHGTVIAESEESCIIYGMPKSVVDNNLADEVLALEKIPVALMQLVDI